MITVANELTSSQLATMTDSRRDYRVQVIVEFDIDVPGTSTAQAEAVAKDITREVFKNSFGRADAVGIRTKYPREL